VSDGELKFSVELENWPWTEDGKFLDIDIIVKVPPGRIVRKIVAARKDLNRPVSFSLGKNATAFFSRKVSIGFESINPSKSNCISVIKCTVRNRNNI